MHLRCDRLRRVPACDGSEDFWRKRKILCHRREGCEGLQSRGGEQVQLPPGPGRGVRQPQAAGMAPPENESDNWKRPVSAENVGAAAEDVAKALEAYGLKKGEAMSLTVATELSK